MCSICNGAYFRTKDQRSKGRGDRWYISQCKRKVRATKVDEEFDKYLEWLCDKSDRLFQEEMNQLLLKELDTMQVAKNDKDIMYTQNGSC